jgi:hypothetical protein
MREFKPVVDLVDLSKLDGMDMVAGYRAGFHGEPEPGMTKSRSFHHGYYNGAVDAGLRQKSAAQAQLAHEHHRWFTETHAPVMH